MSKFSIGQMNQLGDAMEKTGFTPDDVTKLRSSRKVLKGVMDVLRDTARIVPIEHTIDCDADPRMHSDWTLEEHRKGGKFVWNPARIKLHFLNQQKEGLFDGHKLREVLGSQPVLNANVLHYLVTHQEFIPDEWGYLPVIFWGTIFRDSNGKLFVLYLGYLGDEWDCDRLWLDDGVNASWPVAVLVNT